MTPTLDCHLTESFVGSVKVSQLAFSNSEEQEKLYNVFKSHFDVLASIHTNLGESLTALHALHDYVGDQVREMGSTVELLRPAAKSRSIASTPLQPDSYVSAADLDHQPSMWERIWRYL